MVQRLFSMFPTGWPGFALLLLRAAVAIALLLAGYRHVQVLSGWIFGAAALLAAVLCLGYLTPLVAVMALLFHVLTCFALGCDSPAISTIMCLEAIALSILGPGAYSIDSYLFGRRVVVLPPR